MKYRKLRIAWSVAWGVACLLLVALWVRSHTNCDIVFNVTGSGQVSTFGSNRGTVYLSNMFIPAEALAIRPVPFSGGWKHASNEPYDYNDGKGMYDLVLTSSRTSLRVPNYVLVAVTVAIAAAPWLRWSPRFSLRTMLIGMTLLAVGLGWAVYALRN